MMEFHQVSKRYGAQIILDRVDCRLRAGERVGLVGPNGAGKSTVFDLLVGDCEADAGRITRAKDIRIGYLRQQLRAGVERIPVQTYVEQAAPNRETIRREVRDITARLATGEDPDARELLRQLGELQTQFELQGGYDVPARTAATLAGLGFRADETQRPLGEFSGGWQMRAELARALLAEPDVLLLDEPSNYLDVPAVEWLRRRLERFRGTLAMISHDRYLLESLCEVTIEVAGGRMTRYPGRYSYYAVEREKRRELALARQANDDRKREQIERFIERFRAKNTLATRVQSKVKMLAKMERTAVVTIARGRSEFRLPPPSRSGQEVLRCRGVGFAYEPGQWIFRGVDLAVQRGEKLAVVGPNGAGKTTLLRLLAGQLSASEGACTLGHLVAPGYQSQELTDTLDRTRTALDTLKAVAPDEPESAIRSLLGCFGFSGETVEKRVEVLSGGERIRLAFARILIRPPNLLLLDEPTTHLDVESREALQAALAAYAGTVVLVSHDIAFVRAVADGIVAVAPAGGGVRRFAGGYDYYCEKISQEGPVAAGAAEPPESPVKEAQIQAQRERKAQKAERRKLERRLAALEEEIAACEAAQPPLVAQLSADDATPEARQEAGRRLHDITQQIVGLTAEWDALATRLAEGGSA